ncbi:hypothetical protein ADUPG1_009526 [Aduncisulcus paluster]|uniref:Uncharacterized protein n=1 Tax=Aduncisulcus paluster TaxID=2918883 RepID=A0ABQ5KVV9_9EUKA|nr:hypothetical protein ADUPG1_009526 [Aduncisulcus paluster]
MIDAKICLEIPTVHSKLIPKVLSHVKRKEKVIIMERKYNTPYVMCIASIGSQESRAFQRQAAIIMVNTIPAAITALKNLLGSPDFKDKPSLTFNILLLNRDEIGICIPPSLIESPHYSLFSSSFPPHITSRINIIPFFSLDSEWNIAKYILSFFTSSQLATSFRQEKMEMSRRISESQADCECITPLKSSLTSINSKISAPSLDESSSKDYQLSFLAALPAHDLFENVNSYRHPVNINIVDDDCPSHALIVKWNSFQDRITPRQFLKILFGKNPTPYPQSLHSYDHSAVSFFHSKYQSSTQYRGSSNSIYAEPSVIAQIPHRHDEMQCFVRPELPQLKLESIKQTPTDSFPNSPCRPLLSADPMHREGSGSSLRSSESLSIHPSPGSFSSSFSPIPTPSFDARCGLSSHRPFDHLSASGPECGSLGPWFRPSRKLKELSFVSQSYVSPKSSPGDSVDYLDIQNPSMFVACSCGGCGLDPFAVTAVLPHFVSDGMLIVCFQNSSIAKKVKRWLESHVRSGMLYESSCPVPHSNFEGISLSSSCFLEPESIVHLIAVTKIHVSYCFPLFEDDSGHADTTHIPKSPLERGDEIHSPSLKVHHLTLPDAITGRVIFREQTCSCRDPFSLCNVGRLVFFSVCSCITTMWLMEVFKPYGIIEIRESPTKTKKRRGSSAKVVTLTSGGGYQTLAKPGHHQEQAYGVHYHEHHQSYRNVFLEFSSRDDVVHVLIDLYSFRLPEADILLKLIKCMEFGHPGGKVSHCRTFIPSRCPECGPYFDINLIPIAHGYPCTCSSQQLYSPLIQPPPPPPPLPPSFEEREYQHRYVFPSSMYHPPPPSFELAHISSHFHVSSQMSQVPSHHPSDGYVHPVVHSHLPSSSSSSSSSSLFLFFLSRDKIFATSMCDALWKMWWFSW